MRTIEFILLNEKTIACIYKEKNSEGKAEKVLKAFHAEYSLVFRLSKDNILSSERLYFK